MRSPAELAPDPAALAATLTVVHHAACAFEAIAVADQAALRAAYRAGRLYVPTRTLPARYDVPRPYAPVPPDRAEHLDRTYRTCVAAVGRAVAALDRAAIALDAPSRSLAAARAAAAARPATGRARHLPAGRAGSGPAEREIRALGTTDAFMLLRARAVDVAARTLADAAADSTPARPGQAAARIQATPRSSRPACPC